MRYWKRKSFILLREEKGSAVIVLALALTVLLACTSFVVDLGLMYQNKLQVANAADTAALAGIQALPGSEAQAVEIARDYGGRNQVDDIAVNVAGNGHTLEVTARRTIDIFFARVMGFTKSAAQARAVARLEPVTGVRGVVPMGINEQPLVFGETYILKYAASDDPEGEYQSGWLGILALQGPGAKLYLEDLKYGFDQEVRIGDILNIQTGNISGNTYDGVQYRIDQCNHIPYCTAEHYDPACPRVMLVPVIAPYGGENKQVEVKGFSAFLVDSVAGMGNENYITGKFLRHIVPGSSSPEAPDYGIYVPRLVQ